MTTAHAAAQPTSPIVKLLGGATAGLTTAMVSSSLLYLLWFVPLDRPGSHIPTTDEIIKVIKTPDDKRTADQLRADAESVRSTKMNVAKFIYTPFEILLLTSTCLVAAFMASLYGRANDEGDGKNAGGTLLLPTMIGTAAGAVVLWALFSVLVAQPAAAHPQHHAEPSKATPPAGAADHGSQAPKTPPAEKAVHDDHGPKDASTWMAEHAHPMQLTAYMIGTLAAAVVGVMAPRGAAKPTVKSETTSALAH